MPALVRDISLRRLWHIPCFHSILLSSDYTAILPQISSHFHYASSALCNEQETAIRQNLR